MRLSRLAVIVMSACAMSACNVLGDPEPPLNIYDLSAGAHSPAPTSAPLAASIIVDDPDVSRVLDSERILVRLGTNELRYLKESRWSDRAPRLVQLSLIEAFTRAAGFRAAGQPSSSFRSDYRLEGYLRHFEAEAGEGMNVRIAFDVQLVAETRARIVASHSFEARTQAASDSPSDVTRAMDAALASLVGQILPWTHAAVGDDLAAPPAR